MLFLITFFMSNYEKFQNNLRCICNTFVTFEVINDIECDWGIHTVVQCPNCEELFSIDKQCPAFEDISKLLKINPNLYSSIERSNYLANSHPN